MKKNRRTGLLVSGVIALSALLLLPLGNRILTVNRIDFENEKIPAAFDGFKIAHLSDLHNESFGKDNKSFLRHVAETEPDIIVITGDIIDSRRTDPDVIKALIPKMLEIAPIYYVTGNHEARTEAVSADLISFMENAGVILAENKSIPLSVKDESITLCGIADPTFVTGYEETLDEAVAASALSGLERNDGFTLLLSHRPEFFGTYEEYGFDLVLSGHAHGGQFRLPFVGGIIAPGQGFFPEYDAGLYTKNETTMIVSRGIGNSIVPLRINNLPEIVLITLHPSES